MTRRGRAPALIAALVAALLLPGGARDAATAAPADPAAAAITAARYVAPTTRYDHAILGDAIEYGALELTLADGTRRRIVLPTSRVFEDVAPRLADLDGDGRPEVITVETSLSAGARLSVYGAGGLIAATPFLGRTHRWLAPLGAADLDGDGRVEVAYVEKPHLTKILRVWRFVGGRIVPVARMLGLTNHRIGESTIGGGIRRCSGMPEIILASGDWRQVMAVRLAQGQLRARAIGPYRDRQSFARALACGH